MQFVLKENFPNTNELFLTVPNHFVTRMKGRENHTGTEEKRKLNFFSLILGTKQKSVISRQWFNIEGGTNETPRR